MRTLRGHPPRYAVCCVLLATLACAGPQPGVIHYDVDSCDHCRMTISDPAFAGQVVTRTGKIYRFDDPACLVSFVTSSHVAPADVHSIWTNDHAHPDAPVRAQDAVFVVSDRLRAPMNGKTAAFGSRQDAAALQVSVGGQLQTWNDLLARRPS